MPISQEELQTRLQDAFPGAEVAIQDLAGDGDHYRARIVSEAFRGLSRLRQHQLVYQALGGRVGGEIHALALETLAPPES
jgi:stress-induced morphogen